MDIERRALFNSLRQHWLLDPELPVKEWQVMDYRVLPIEELFGLMKESGYGLDRDSFLAYAEISESPEEMTVQLSGDDLDQSSMDRLYLVVFELWRRLLPERRSLSVFCDELDRCIYLYDNGKLSSLEPLENTLAELIQIILENKDEGEDPAAILALIGEGCANDIEAFLFDFISETIDQEGRSYAKDLIESLKGTFEDPKWLELLEARIIVEQDPHEAHHLVDYLIDEGEGDVEFYLELMRFLVQAGDKELFRRAAESALSLLELPEEYEEWTSLVQDYFHFLDKETEENLVESILKRNQENVSKTNDDLKRLLDLL